MYDPADCSICLTGVTYAWRDQIAYISPFALTYFISTIDNKWRDVKKVFGGLK